MFTVFINMNYRVHSQAAIRSRAHKSLAAGRHKLDFNSGCDFLTPHGFYYLYATVEQSCLYIYVSQPSRCCSRIREYMHKRGFELENIIACVQQVES